MHLTNRSTLSNPKTSDRPVFNFLATAFFLLFSLWFRWVGPWSGHAVCGLHLEKETESLSLGKRYFNVVPWLRHAKFFDLLRQKCATLSVG